jgi:hypothetical protein
MARGALNDGSIDQPAPLDLGKASGYAVMTGSSEVTG